jgi:hypothetical protein
MFVRIKKIKGYPYAYLARNRWTKKGTRQKTKYLGRVYELERVHDADYQIVGGPAKDIIASVVAWTLKGYGFINKGNMMIKEDIAVNLETQAVRLGKQDIVIKLGADFMCQETLRKLMRFKSDKDAKGVGTELAKAFVGAGIPVPPDVFVEVFNKIYKEGQSYA